MIDEGNIEATEIDKDWDKWWSFKANRNYNETISNHFKETMRDLRTYNEGRLRKVNIQRMLRWQVRIKYCQKQEKYGVVTVPDISYHKEPMRVYRENMIEIFCIWLIFHPLYYDLNVWYVMSFQDAGDHCSPQHPVSSYSKLLRTFLPSCFVVVLSSIYRNSLRSLLAIFSCFFWSLIFSTYLSYIIRLRNVYCLFTIAGKSAILFLYFLNLIH